MPRVGETWRTRVGPYTVRLIADDATGPFPVVGLIRIGENDVAWNWTTDGRSRDLWDSGFDLVAQVVNSGEELPPGWVNQSIDEQLKQYARADD